MGKPFSNPYFHSQPTTRSLTTYQQTVSTTSKNTAGFLQWTSVPSSGRKILL